MAKNVARFILERLNEWGVKRIYGYPGDGINAMLGAFHEVEDRIEFVQTAHEELAAFAATAHAKLTDEVGVCMATSGPGAIHLLNGLYDAKLDYRPVVAIVGQQARMSLGGNYMQEVDLPNLFKDVAHEYVQVCMVPQQARHLIDRAIRIAKATRSVTCIIVPDDVAESDYEEPPRKHGAAFSGGGFPALPRLVPEDEDLRRAAEVLNAGQKVSMLIGAGARHAAEEVREIADILGCGVAKALNGRDALPDDLPFVTGAVGHQAQLRDDGELRHALHGRLGFPLLGVAAGAGPGARRVDRHRRQDARHPLPYGGQRNRRQQEDPEGAHPVPAAQGGPFVAGEDRERCLALVGDPREPGDAGRRTLEPPKGLPRAKPTPARPLHRHRRLGLDHELVGAKPQAA